MSSSSKEPGCTRHQMAKLSYVCLDCNDELVCPECRNDLHKGHNLHDVSDVITIKREVIRQYAESISSSESRLFRGTVEDTNDALLDNSVIFGSMKEDIRRQGEIMKDEIDSAVDRLVAICTNIERYNVNLLETYQSSRQEETEQPGVEICETVISSGTDEEVIKLAKICQNQPSPVKLQRANFFSRPVANEHLQHMLGSLKVDGLDHAYQRANKFTTLSQFQHVSTVSTCRATEQGHAWLSHWGEDAIYRVDQHGHIQEKVCCGMKVRHMALSPATGTVWFCCWEDGTVREVVDKPVTRIETDLSPMSLCVTADSTVVVGVAGNISLYTTDGRTVTAEDLPCRQPAVTPHHLACCTQTGDVAAADNEGVVYDEYISGTDTGKHPHVKVMDKHLKLRFRYPDNAKQGDAHHLLRYPYDVCFDGTGDILVADWATHSVLQIDGGRGHFLRTVYSGDAAPHTISRQHSGALWVGLMGRNVKVLKYREEHEEG